MAAPAPWGPSLRGSPWSPSLGLKRRWQRSKAALGGAVQLTRACPALEARAGGGEAGLPAPAPRCQGLCTPAGPSAALAGLRRKAAAGRQRVARLCLSPGFRGAFLSSGRASSFPTCALGRGHSTTSQSHHRTSVYEGDRVSPVLISHDTEVPSRATAWRGRAAPLAAAAAGGRGGTRSGTGRQRGSPARGTETPPDPPGTGQWEAVGLAHPQAPAPRRTQTMLHVQHGCREQGVHAARPGSSATLCSTVSTTCVFQNVLKPPSLPL